MVTVSQLMPRVARSAVMSFTNSAKVVFRAFHPATMLDLNSESVSQSVLNAAARVAITPTTARMGADKAAVELDISPKPFCTLPTIVTRPEKAVTILPMTMIAGPIAATIAAIWTRCSFSSSVSAFILSAHSWSCATTRSM